MIRLIQIRSNPETEHLRKNTAGVIFRMRSNSYSLAEMGLKKEFRTRHQSLFKSRSRDRSVQLGVTGIRRQFRKAVDAANRSTNEQPQPEEPLRFSANIPSLQRADTPSLTLKKLSNAVLYRLRTRTNTLPNDLTQQIQIITQSKTSNKHKLHPTQPHQIKNSPLPTPHRKFKLLKLIGSKIQMPNQPRLVQQRKLFMNNSKSHGDSLLLDK